MNWSMISDKLSLKDKDLNIKSFTKRNMLSIIGRIFDPIGILEPLKLPLGLLSRIVKKKIGMI